jgi:UDP-N-acetylglucosamine--N-acetylmuramyl-(pentapeptide) pyrophosphoryl-undecaprenol N-acetylglucosamine transferase
MLKQKVMISGGGTGGHIFPAVAIADEIKKRNPSTEFLFVGAKDKMEMEKVPQAGYPIIGLWISGIQRKLTTKNLSFPFKLISSLWKSRKIINEFKPSAVIGTGGFASGPLLFVASRKGIPCLIQEQNSYPGITNKLLSAKVLKICTAYEGMDRFFPKEKLILTGNPLRKGLEKSLPADAASKMAFGLNPEWPTLLILGGSLGAGRINEMISDQLSSFLRLELNVIWQCGKLYSESLEKRHPNLPNHFKLQAFITDMKAAYSASDFVISRAGANTLSELAAAGKAAILIPSPNVAEDHQTKNAEALSAKNAALLFKENRSSLELFEIVSDFIDRPEIGQNLAQNISAMALPNAAAHIVDEIEKMLPHA